MPRPSPIAMKTVSATSIFLAILCWLCLSCRLTTATDFPDLYEASVVELQNGLDNGDFTSVDLIKVSATLTSLRVNESGYMHPFV